MLKKYSQLREEERVEHVAGNEALTAGSLDLEPENVEEVVVGAIAGQGSGRSSEKPQAAKVTQAL